MSNRSTGISFSILVHVMILLFFFGLPLSKPDKNTTLSLDFTITNGNDSEGLPGRTGARQEHRHRSSGLKHGGKAGNQEAGLTGIPGTSPLPGEPGSMVLTESQGRVSVQGISLSPGGESTHDREVSRGQGTGGLSGGQGAHTGSGTGVPGGPLLVNYGDGGTGGGFAFIRENIMRNVRYPERARRMGWEGRVVLSFTVNETGVVDDVKVVKSSGFASLDEGAQEGVRKTRFAKKIPARLSVILPVEYRLSN